MSKRNIMLNAYPEGEFIRASKKRDGILRPESKNLIKDIADAVAPELERVTGVISDKTKAERMVVLNCIRRVNQSKSFLKNYLVSNVFSAIALSVFLQSEHLDKIGNLFYERRDSGQDNHYDILNIDSWTESKSANLPAPILDRLFMRTLVEKIKIVNYLPDFRHNRTFYSTMESASQVAQLVGDVLLEMSKTVDIKIIIDHVYGKESYIAKNWKRLNQVITDVKNGSISKEEYYKVIAIDENDHDDEFFNESVVYTAQFVEDTEGLLKQFPPKHQNIFATHSTISFRPDTGLKGIAVGEKTRMKVIARVFDIRGDALLVENSKSENEHPHITLSCADGVPAKYSKEMIAAALKKGKVKFFNEPVEVDVIEGYSNGVDTIIS